jgi:hypothetical protein
MWLIRRTQTQFLHMISGSGIASNQLCNRANYFVPVNFSFLSKDLN